MTWLQRFIGRQESLGNKGERLAARWLKRRGYRIVERNRRAGKDEADIIAFDPDSRTLVIVEVKTRVDDRILPEEHVGRKKQHNLSRLASRLLKEKRYSNRPIRFDVIAVICRLGESPKITHYVGAFNSTI